MAQPKQESTPTPASTEAGSDALGAQVDALLDEMDQAVKGLEQEAKVADTGADTDGFEASSFAGKAPPGALRVANAEQRAPEPHPASASGGPSIEQSPAELDAAIDAALKRTEPAPAEESAPPAKQRAASPAPAAPEARAAGDIVELDERLADTATDRLDDDIDALLKEAPTDAAPPAAPTVEPPSAAASVEAPSAPAEPEAAAPTPSESESPSSAAEPVAQAPEPKVEAPAPPTPAVPVAPPAPPTPSAAPTPAPAEPKSQSPSDTRVEVVVGEPLVGRRRAPLLTTLCVGVLKVVGAPLAIMPPSARDIVGYFSLVTLFNAAGLWILILLRH